MKKFTYLGLFVMMFNLVVIQTGLASSGQLTILVDGFENDTGHLRISLINKASEFKDGGQSFQKQKIQIINKQAKVTFTDVPYGQYAIQLYHDENDNDQLDRFPLFGWPTELYGFSNNKRNSSGRAGFDEAKFYLESESKNLAITVKGYW